MKYRKEIIIGILILIVFCMSLSNSVKLFRYQSVVTHDYCVEWAYGDDWVKDNCHLNNESKYDYCPIIIDGNSYNVALQSINISRMQSCRKLVPAIEILVKYGGIE